MNWYYARDHQQAGPVSDEELAPLIRSGAIVPATLVWHSGLAGWQPFAEASAALPAALRPALKAGEATVGADQAMCSQCGRGFPADEVVNVGGFNVCGACKPRLLQKLLQGVADPGVYGVTVVRYAGFWVRVGAAIIDFLVAMPFNFVFNRLFVTTTWQGNPFDPESSPFAAGFRSAFGWPSLVLVALTAVYSALCLSRFGGMPGMLVCGLRAVRSDGRRITFWRGVGRFFANYLNVFTLGLAYLIVVFDDQKRTLQDYLCDTRVIHK